MKLFKNINIFDITRALMIYTLLLTTVLIIISFFKVITFETACIPMLSVAVILIVIHLHEWFKKSDGYKHRMDMI